MKVTKIEIRPKKLVFLFLFILTSLFLATFIYGFKQTYLLDMLGKRFILNVLTLTVYLRLFVVLMTHFFNNSSLLVDVIIENIEIEVENKDDSI